MMHLSFLEFREFMLMVATLRGGLLGGDGIGVGKVVLRKLDAMFFRTALECRGVSDTTGICLLDLVSYTEGQGLVDCLLGGCS